MIDIRQTKQYANYLKATGWTVKRISNVNYSIKSFGIFGSFLKLQRPEKIDIKRLKKLIKKHHVFQISIEPKNSNDLQRLTSAHGFKLSDPYLPSKTLLLDLTKSQSHLLKNMRKNTRHVLRHTKIQVKTNPDLKLFRRTWKKTVGWRRYIPTLNNITTMQTCFGKNALFLLDQNTNTGAIFLKTKEMAYYWQAFTDKAGRQKSVQFQIVWQGILWAKKSGCKFFDFEGIYDERFPNQSWRGFSFFKAGFGGKIKTYPKPCTKIFLFSGRDPL